MFWEVLLMEPTVTIGICVKNCEATIKDTIKSVIDQEFTNGSLRLIFVDDGSSDQTLKIIKECVSTIDIPCEVFSIPWNGLGYARNLVLSKTPDNYVLWVDGDMVLSKFFVKTLINFMQNHDSAAIVKGRHKLACEIDAVSTLEVYSRAQQHLVDYQSSKSRFKSLGTGGALYRVDVAREVGGFDEGLKFYGEDWDIELRIRDAGWSLHIVVADFFDGERCGMNWSILWKKYWIRGYYAHYFFHKNRDLLKKHTVLPIAAAFSGLLRSPKIYRSVHKKFVFMLPLHSFFKMSAWCVGYVKSHFVSYVP